jgi:HJR/Mrr/RecB family endonuclease
MGLLNGDRQRAVRALSEMYQRRLMVIPRDTEWRIAQEMLTRSYTREAAESSSIAASVRIKYLQVPEPAPVRENFLPPTPPPPHKSVQALEEVERRFEQAWHEYASRESWRAKEIEYIKSVHARVAAAERVQCIERNRARWPAGTDIDDGLLAIDDMAIQVDAQNEKLDEHLEEVGNLLARGLADNPRETAGPTGHGDDPQRITDSVENALVLMQLPDGFGGAAKVGYSPESRQVVVEYELPKDSVIPKAKTYRWIKNRSQVQATPRPAAQVKSLYADSIAQLTLLALHVIFAANPAIDVAVFNGVVDTLDPRTGKPIRPCLITVRVTRETYEALDLLNVDPAACLKHLNAGISKSPTELSPVRPVIEFSMVDPRFIAETDAMSGMDSRPNLMDLTPGEFETLIQNLFTKMGLEARQTRASRDGGVDCVAYDTRPIFGGKVVIQAKRYKNTVGVSAVRDLFGTLQNEGASKGILVTTSGYGTASFDFAQNKPIELIDGANLLYLLEEHAGIIARIEPPDDWRDPTPDSAPLYPEDRVSPPQ